MTRPPSRISKLSVVEVRGENQRMALDEYSPLVVRFFYPRLIFDPLLRGKRPASCEIDHFQIHRREFQKL